MYYVQFNLPKECYLTLQNGSSNISYIKSRAILFQDKVEADKEAEHAIYSDCLVPECSYLIREL